MKDKQIQIITHVPDIGVCYVSIDIEEKFLQLEPLQAIGLGEALVAAGRRGQVLNTVLAILAEDGSDPTATPNFLKRILSRLGNLR